MGLLRTAPTERIRSLPELVAIAHAMETEAAERYAELAAYMRRIGNPATAEVLDALSAEERGHVDAVARLSQSSIGRAPDMADFAWEHWPEVFDAEDLAGFAPRHALSRALGRGPQRGARLRLLELHERRRRGPGRPPRRRAHGAGGAAARRQAAPGAPPRLPRRPSPRPRRDRPRPASPPPRSPPRGRCKASTSSSRRGSTALGHPAADTLGALAAEQAAAARAISGPRGRSRAPAVAAPAGRRPRRDADRPRRRTLRGRRRGMLPRRRGDRRRGDGPARSATRRAAHPPPRGPARVGATPGRARPRRGPDRGGRPRHAASAGAM